VLAALPRSVSRWRRKSVTRSWSIWASLIFSGGVPVACWA
jgi:hypothetical protein